MGCFGQLSIDIQGFWLTNASLYCLRHSPEKAFRNVPLRMQTCENGLGILFFLFYCLLPAPGIRTHFIKTKSSFPAKVFFSIRRVSITFSNVAWTTAYNIIRNRLATGLFKGIFIVLDFGISGQSSQYRYPDWPPAIGASPVMSPARQHDHAPNQLHEYNHAHRYHRG